MNTKAKVPNEAQTPPSKEAPIEIGSTTRDVYMADKQESFLIDGISAIAIHNGVARLKTFRFSAGDSRSDPLEVLIP